MEPQWKMQSSSFWMLFLGIFLLTKTQAELHSLEFQIIVVLSPRIPPDIFFNGFLDDHLIISYNSPSKDLIFKLDRVNTPMQNFMIQHYRTELLKLETEIDKILQDKTQYYNWTEETHTGQAFMNCEIDRGILVNSHMGVAFDGEDVCHLDMKEERWIVMKLEDEFFCPYQKDHFWANTIRGDCTFLLKLLLQIVHLKEKTPPEVTVSRYHSQNGSLIFSCLATGFYPRSILLHWEKDGKLGIWGEESSSGTLPNADSTYYLHVTLKLPPEDPGKGYACLIEHSELEKPTVYPVPGETTKRSSWAVILSSTAAAIFVLSLLAAFIIWKKKKTGMTPLSQLECSFPPLFSPAL
ncbi:zinc-alpha-2-glycoprotein [Sarcophilus harrisii]|uniref:Ig-like domain-containing protein n=1 Tax=Sarcophilus harrisii TaxID=9305 RepID=G3VWY8_SARHA|nr:zinc-alpha-2-glycoprotein [Sarcophilus harrisii]XP_031805593.1 zinc-alpha-2-glycoprotein [Sarcophilus harrisii]XP_031805594.1 zinc-alpha-2-glycoprotein [Sarcophilus harrisii]